MELQAVLLILMVRSQKIANTLQPPRGPGSKRTEWTSKVPNFHLDVPGS